MADSKVDRDFDRLDEKLETSINEGLLQDEDEDAVKEYQHVEKHQRTGSLSLPQNVMNETSEAVTTVEDALLLIGGFGRF